eukprot:Opistho-2@73155
MAVNVGIPDFSHEELSNGGYDDDEPLCDGGQEDRVRLQSFVAYRDGVREDQWVETCLARLHDFRRSRTALWLACIFLVGCGLAIGFPLGHLIRSTAKPTPNNHPLTVLISLDGFRADFLSRGLTPNIARMGQRGVMARSMLPCFPTKTFPNHHSIITGLYPDIHGIVNNGFVDPSYASCRTFSLRDESHLDPKWWGGVPIWAAAEMQGLATAIIDWPGSDVPIAGIRPSFWRPYPGHVSTASIAQMILEHANSKPDSTISWLRGYNAKKAPCFIAAYVPTVDTVAHMYGPDSPEVNAAISEVDTAIGTIFASISPDANIVILSDHGMSAISWNRSIVLDDFVPSEWLTVSAYGPVAFLDPTEATTARDIFDRLEGVHPQMVPYMREDLPARFHYGSNRRVSRIVVLAEPGWCIVTKSIIAVDPTACSGGNHGYDNEATDMGAIFVAQGPAFKSGVIVDLIANLDVYPLLGRLLGISVAPNNGTSAAISLLR